MAINPYVKKDTRTSADKATSADMNTEQDNTTFMRGDLTAVTLNGATNVSLAADSTIKATLTANSVITWTNVVKGQSGFIDVIQDGSSVFTLSAAGTVWGDTLVEPSNTSEIDKWSYVVSEVAGASTLRVTLSKKLAINV